MPRLGVPQQIGAFEHARHGFDRRGVERDDAMARLVLAPSNVQQSLDEIHIAPANVLHLNWAHRGVRRDDRSAVNVLPLRIRGSGLEQPPPFLWCQRSADGPLPLGEVMDVIRQRSPPAAELQHARQHADIHVDRAIRDAGVVTGALKVGDRRRRDRGERHVAKVLLDDAEPLLLEFDRASGAPDPFRSQVRVDCL